MIAALAWRDATIIVRTPGYWAAVGTYALLLGLFVLIWGGGLPVLAGSALDQIAVIQLGALVALLPWTAIRCSDTSTDEVRLLATVTASPPSLIVGVRCVVTALSLCALVCMGLPVMVMAQQISAAPAGRIAAAVAPALGMCALVAILAVSSALMVPSRLGGWVLATAATAAAVYSVPSWASPSAWFVGLAVVGLAGLALLERGRA